MPGASGIIGRDYNPGKPCRVPAALKCLVNALTGEVKSFQNHLYDYPTYRDLARGSQGRLVVKGFGARFRQRRSHKSYATSWFVDYADK